MEKVVPQVLMNPNSPRSHQSSTGARRSFRGMFLLAEWTNLIALLVATISAPGCLSPRVLAMAAPAAPLSVVT